MKHLRIGKLIDRINGKEGNRHIIFKQAEKRYVRLQTDEDGTMITRKEIIKIAHGFGLITAEEINMLKKSEREVLE